MSAFPGRYEMSYDERLEILKQFFLRELVDDPIDGSRFDCDVLDALEKLQKQYEGVKP